MLNEPVDLSKEFESLDSDYFCIANVENFDSKSGRGLVKWKRFSKKKRMAFNQVSPRFEEAVPWEFPAVYEKDLILPFEITPVSNRTLRLRFGIRPEVNIDNDSLIISRDLKWDKSWQIHEGEGLVRYFSNHVEAVLTISPFHFEIRDRFGRSMVKTWHFADTKCLDNTKPIPFSFVRNSDLHRIAAISLTLHSNEKIFGCGESFTRLNKRGQKLVLWCNDANTVQSSKMYKPVPFFMSNKGYGVFVHTSTPVTFDFGYSYDEATTIFLCDPLVELFFFFGTPKEILSEYTALTGRSSLPPLWSFGLWMSRITYRSEEEVKEVAESLRSNCIPCDVIHIDTGWFEKEWLCDYRFSSCRFPKPKELFEELKQMGFRVSIWQMPYFVPCNTLYRTLLEKGYAVSGFNCNLPTEDAIIDFSNPEAVQWYKSLLRGILEMGVSAIKADFGEAAPLCGQYFSGKSGLFEHNLYPLRYEEAVAEIVKDVTGDSVIWARSAWAGCHRYPVHWGGDAESTLSGMAATLRGGLSLGLCGFSFWSHDIGGFTGVPSEELYKKWLAFGMFTSHCRCHGSPPREPWEFSPGFIEDFRKIVEVRYRLMPYIYAQAILSAESGFPMLRTLFFEYPFDKTSWFIEDEYLFGDSLLVAPLFEESSDEREVYLPEGATWIDYQTHRVYQGGKWYSIRALEVPIIVLVKVGTVLPHLEVSQSTAWMNWRKVEAKVYCTEDTSLARCHFYYPRRKEVYPLEFERKRGKRFMLVSDPLNGDVEWKVVEVQGKINEEGC